MKLLWFSLLIIGAHSYYIENDDAEEHKKERIVGGRNVTIDRFPYQAQLLENGAQICGASIISEKWLIGAAHCFTESKPTWSILTGSSSKSIGGSHHVISKVIVHPKYDRESDDNDIALIKLKNPIEFNENQKPIHLATKLPKTGDIMTITGFGKKGEFKGYSEVLQTATVPVVEHATCERRYVRDHVTENMFCAGNGPTDACQGDSGGPGIIDGELAGVVSSGMDCGSNFYPGIYTTVYNYLDWIAKETGISKQNQSPKPTTTTTTARPAYQPKTLFGKIIHDVITFIAK